MNKIIEDLNWRYATKTFDSNQKISKEDFQILLESLRLSPSSFGLQPWKFVIVENTDLRTELLGQSWNQKQVTDASHLIVLCRINKIDDEFVDRFVEDIVNTRGGSLEDNKGYSDMMKGFLSRMDQAQKATWASMQVYIALGQLMTTAAHMRIDACPMEGFSAEGYDKILGLSDKGLTAVVVCPVGYRSNEDKYATAAKVRYNLDDLIIKQ